MKICIVITLVGIVKFTCKSAFRKDSETVLKHLMFFIILNGRNKLERLLLTGLSNLMLSNAGPIKLAICNNRFYCYLLIAMFVEGYVSSYQYKQK